MIEWLDQNIDAYRNVAEILHKLRSLIHRELEATHGSEWHKHGIPDEVMSRLIRRKEREMAIDWHESEYQEIINYASFADVLQILERTAGLLPEIKALAPNSALFHTRFLELDVLTRKISMARPISETELGFLGTFYIRFRKVVTEVESRDAGINPEQAEQEQEQPDLMDASGEYPAITQTDLEDTPLPFKRPPELDSQSPAAPEAAAAAPQPAKNEAPVSQPAPEPPTKPNQVAAAAGAATPAPPAEEPKGNEGADTRLTFRGSRPRPPMRPATAPGTQPAAAPASPAAPTAAVTPPATSSETAERPAPTPPAQVDAEGVTEPDDAGGGALEKALAKADNQTILQELYREVTTIAEGLWTNEVVPTPAVWLKVSANSWYQGSFDKLGLKPLSDFYLIIERVEQKMEEGLARDQLQDFLKQCNFAKTLMDLRDMFQKNDV